MLPNHRPGAGAVAARFEQIARRFRIGPHAGDDEQAAPGAIVANQPIVRRDGLELVPIEIFLRGRFGARHFVERAVNVGERSFADAFALRPQRQRRAVEDRVPLRQTQSLLAVLHDDRSGIDIEHLFDRAQLGDFRDAIGVVALGELQCFIDREKLSRDVFAAELCVLGREEQQIAIVHRGPQQTARPVPLR